MIEENEMLKTVVKELFPGIKLYENDVPKDFKRPCFIFIEPEDRSDTEELTKIVMKVTKTMTMYAFYPEDNGNLGNELRQKLQEYLMREKKHLIPGSNGRYFTVESCSTDTNKVECLIEYAMRISRTVSRNLPRPQAEIIRNIVTDFKIKED